MNQDESIPYWAKSAIEDTRKCLQIYETRSTSFNQNDETYQLYHNQINWNILQNQPEHPPEVDD